MKISKKIAALLAMAVVAANTALASPTSLGGTAAVDDGNDDWLHAVGSRLYDKDGNEVWLTGANWFGFNCSENCAHGLYAVDCDEFLSSCAYEIFAEVLDMIDLSHFHEDALHDVQISFQHLGLYHASVE